MIRTITAAALVAVLAAPAAFAKLSPEFENFGKGPAKHLMTRDEQKQWKSISSDDEATKFIALFWARRDPTPGTPANELKMAFDERVEYADRNFAVGKNRGSLTDRGRVLILLGAPTEGKRTGAGGATNIQTPDTTFEESEAKMAREMWRYEKSDKPAVLTYKGGNLEVNFTDQFGNGEFRLVMGGRPSIADVLNNAAAATIVSPSLTLDEVAKWNAPPPPPPAPVAPAAAPTTLTSESFKTAVSAFRAGSAAAKKANVTYGEFITPDGEYYVPVQLYVTKDAGVAADAKATFFGIIEDASGTSVAAFEDPVSVVATKNDFYVDKSIRIPAGKYKGIFGVAVDGNPVAMGQADLNLTGLDKGGEGVSRLILSNDLVQLPPTWQVSDPFSFGGIKIVPRGNRTFAKSEDLHIFFELRNPGIDPTTNAPKLQSSIEIENVKTKKKKGAPLSEEIAVAFPGVTGHYGVERSIPLGGFEPGDYTLKVKLIDMVNKQTFNLQESFTVVP